MWPLEYESEAWEQSVQWENGVGRVKDGVWGMEGQSVGR